MFFIILQNIEFLYGTDVPKLRDMASH